MRKCSSVVTGLILAWVTSPALAQSGEEAISGDENAEEVVVTARLREEPEQDVPVALTVLGEDVLRARRVDDTQSLFRQVPGLSLTSFDDGRFAYFQLRGIGPLSQAISPDDASVVTYVDGVPQPVYASEFAYVDLERIEVLRGPQGTLFGRNSQGGAINIVTRQPGRDLEGGARLEAGEDGFVLAQASLSGALADDLAAGIAARVSSVDGFLGNVAPNGGSLGDRETEAARGTLVWSPGGTGARLTLTAQVDRQDSAPFYYVLRNQPERLVELDPENRVRRTFWGVSVRGDLPLGFADLVTIVAANGFHNEQDTDDTDGLIYGPLFGLPSSAFLPPNDFSDWTEDEDRVYAEARLVSPAGTPASWAAGAAYFRSDFDVLLRNRSSFSPFLNGERDATQTIRSYAAFGEATAPIIDPRLKLTLGARYTRDEKGLDLLFTGVGFPGTVDRFAQQADADYDLVTGRAALSFEPSDRATFYATAGRGAKSGGFARFALGAALGQASEPYRKSTSWSYETGAKLRFARARVGLDLAAFYNDVDDEQLFVLDFVSFQFLPVNLDTRSYGLEAQGFASLGSGWTASAGLAWTDAEVRQADARSGAGRGNRVPNVAPISTTATLGYEGDGQGQGDWSLRPTFTLTHQFVGERAADVAESFELPSYHNIDLRLGARTGGLELYLFARNLFDARQELNGVLYGPGVEGTSYARGRVAGLGLSGRF